MHMAEHNVSGDPIARDKVRFIAGALGGRIGVDGRHGRCEKPNETLAKLQKKKKKGESISSILMKIYILPRSYK